MKQITFKSNVYTLRLTVVTVIFLFLQLTTVFATENVDLPVACTGTVVNSFPYGESFENGLGEWTQNTGDDGNWTLRSGRTPSGNNGGIETGPAQASDQSFYYYTESSTAANPGPNATTILTSPCLDLSSLSEAYFSFDYHMAGTNIGSMDVEVSDDSGGTWTNVFSQTGQVQTQEIHPWRKEIIDLTSYVGTTINVRFVGNTGPSFRSDIAIDNINLTEEPQYCGAMGIFNNSTIRRVVFNTIDNSSPIESIGYTDFTGISTDVTQGDAHDLTVQINTNGNFIFGIYAWIDWNQDNVFSDASERYDLGTATNVTNSPTSNSPLSITVPAGAVIGQTRMRVISRFNGFPNSSCDEDNNFFGEVEDYTINVISATPQPEMDITGLGNSIPDGDTTPILTDDTDFGSVIIGNSNANTFTISNNGNLSLNLTGPTPYATITGSPNFTLTATPSNTIAIGGITTFQITYAPTAIGADTATLSIANDDLDEDPYNFTITGQGTGPEPEIGITGQGNNILDNDTLPTSSDGTDFGNLLIGSSSFTDFIINNTGSANLNLTGAAPYVTLTGANPGQFALTTAPTTPIPSSGGSTTFRITYNPTFGGTHNATISIANNDSNENPYNFDITGFASNTLIPEIEITGEGMPILINDTTPSILDGSDLGTTTINNTLISDFTINNIGSGLLTLTGVLPHIQITGPDAALFTVSTVPTSTITAGGSTTFQINYSPVAIGTHNAEITVFNDDSNESNYNFFISGSAAASIGPQTTVYYENFDINNGGWTATNPGGNSIWTYGTNGVEPGTEGDYWYTDNYDNYASNSDTYLTSPIIDLTGFNNVQIKMDIRYDTNNDTDDGMNVDYSTNGGSTWQILGTSGGGVVNWYNSTSVNALGSGVDGWSGLNTGGAGGGRSDFVQAIINAPASLFNNATTRIRVRFASDNSINDNGVNVDNIFILGDAIVPLGDPTIGPGDIATNLKLWLKTNSGTNGVTDGNNIANWSDQAFNNDSRLANNTAPVYYNNATENINHNPVLYFDSINDTQLKGKGGFYTDEYWIVMQSDGSINSSSSLEGIVSGRITPNAFGEDGTGLWINPGSIRFQNEDNIVSHMIGATPGNTDSGSPQSYGRAFTDNSTSYDNEVIIFNVKFDPITGESAIFKNGIQIDDYTGRAFNQTTGVQGGVLDYDTVENSNYVLGVGRITIAGTPFDSHYNGKMTEFISYAVPNSVFDQERIQSYLAIKNGVTLHDRTSTTETREGDENYIDSSGDIIWDTIEHNGFNYDIAGIGRDDDSELNQKQSTSSNPGTVVTMGLTDVYDNNLENTSLNTNIFPDRNFLMWGNNNAPFAASTPISVNLSDGIAGLSTLVDFTAIQRTWKVVETGSVDDVKVVIPEIALSATLSPPGDYLMFISETPSFSPTSEFRIMSLNGSNLEASYDFNGTKYITFGFAPEYFYERSITFDGNQDYLDVDDNLNLTGPFTISFWMNRDNTGTRTVLSKSDAGFTEGYEVRVLGDGRVNMRWRNATGANQALTSFANIPSNEWHQVAFVYNGTRLYIYVDGVLDRSTNRSVPVSTNRHFLIGAEDDRNPSSFYRGTLDEIRIWDIALTEDQLRFIMNQEIEENIDFTVAGDIVPTTISKNEFSATNWSELVGYFPMNRYTFTNVKDESNNGLIASIRNLDTVDFQTAPLPYISEANGNWTTASSWENGSTQELPGAISIADPAITIDWNIVQTAHDITTNSNNTVLSLQVISDELSIENNSKMEVSHYLKLDGIIDLVEESQLVQTENSDLDISSGGNLERDQQGTADTYSYNFWSSPVSTVNATENNQDYSISDLMLDGSSINNPTSMLFSGGLNGAPGSPIVLSAAWLFKFANDPAGDYASWQYVGPSGNLTPGQGYTMKGPGTGDVADPQNYTFKGKPNNSIDSDEINFEIFAGNQYLIGNPFPSALDADDFITDNPHLDGTLYFWQHFGGGTHILAGYQGGYATYTLAGGVPAVSHPSVDQTGSGTITPGRYIPVGQGFFAGATTAGTIILNNSQRNFVKETSSSSFFFFTGNQIDNTTASATADSDSNSDSEFQRDDSYYDAPDLRQKLRLSFVSPEQFQREILLTVDENATLEYDRMYDGLNPGGAENDDMKWMIDGQQFVIQAIKDIPQYLELPLLVTTTSSGFSSISISNIENENLNTDIFLKDVVQNSYTNLKEDVFNIDLEPGVHSDRFYIVFKVDQESNSTDNETADSDNETADSDKKPDDSNQDTTDETDDTTGDSTTDNESETDQDIITTIEINNEITELSLSFDNNNKMILISKNRNTSITSVSLYNLLGQVIKQWQPNSNTSAIQLPVSEISTGTYLVNLQTETGIVTEKIIIH